MAGVFVTSTGTSLGKTFLVEQLLTLDRQQNRCLRAIKPIITGWPYDNKEKINTDTGKLLAAQGLDVSAWEAISPWRYHAPLTPSRAALKENKDISIKALIDYCQNEVNAHSDKITLIEGVGGVMAPINGAWTVVDWIKALKYPCLLVVGTYLGSLSHTLSAITVLQHYNCPIMGVVLNDRPSSEVGLIETLETLQSILPDIPFYSFDQTKCLYTVLRQVKISNIMPASQIMMK